ncbi:MAG: SDR family oxidoreductase, partial [Propionibacteriaceae bacterium]
MRTTKAPDHWSGAFCRSRAVLRRTRAAQEPAVTRTSVIRTRMRARRSSGAVSHGQPSRMTCFSRSSSPFVEEWRSRDPEGAQFYWEPLDAVDRQGLVRFVKTVSGRFGRIDALVNNSAVAPEGILTTQPVADIQRLLSVNLESTIFLTQACAKVMLATGAGGSIVSISSVNALRGSSGVAVYSATKAAIDGFTRSLARELGPEGIRVNSVAPGYFESEMTRSMPDAQRAKLVRRTPLGRLATVADVVAAVGFLLSDSAACV